MREAIDRWLEPIMRAMEERDDINVQALLDAATTVTKLEKPRKWWRPPPAGDDEGRATGRGSASCYVRRLDGKTTPNGPANLVAHKWRVAQPRLVRQPQLERLRLSAL